MDACSILLGSEDGLLVGHLDDSGFEITHRSLEGQAVRDIDIHDDDLASVLVGCGLRGWGLYEIDTTRDIVTSRGFDDVWVWGVERPAHRPTMVLVGTEPPLVHRSDDGGRTFAPLEAVEALASREQWTFFHEPFRAGHVHGFSLHPNMPDRIVAGVEHGALIYTNDGGHQWDEALVGRDVHRTAIDPTDPNRVLAATGSGLFESVDACRTWEQIDALAGRYLHTVRFDSHDPTGLLVYADRPGNPLARSDDGGMTWRSIGEGLPAAGPADVVRSHPTEPGTVLYVGDIESDESQLYVRQAGQSEWTAVGDPLPKVWRLATARVPVGR